MVVMPRLRTFRLSLSRDDSGVFCNAQGFFARAIPAFGKTRFLDRSAHRQAEHRADGLLSTPHRRFGEERRFGADSERVQSRRSRHGRNRGRQMQFPDPPGLGKTETIAELKNRAAELHRSGLPKVWEESEHPRTGTPPNPGWFAPVNGAPQPPVDVAMFPDDRNRLWDRFYPVERVGGGGSNQARRNPHRSALSGDRALSRHQHRRRHLQRQSQSGKLRTSARCCNGPLSSTCFPYSGATIPASLSPRRSMTADIDSTSRRPSA